MPNSTENDPRRTETNDDNDDALEPGAEGPEEFEDLLDAFDSFERTLEERIDDAREDRDALVYLEDVVPQAEQVLADARIAPRPWNGGERLDRQLEALEERLDDAREVLEDDQDNPEVGEGLT